MSESPRGSEKVHAGGGENETVRGRPSERARECERMYECERENEREEDDDIGRMSGR